MRLYVIDDEKEIDECQSSLARGLLKAGEFRSGNYGHLGHSQDMDMRWFPTEKFWWAYQKATGTTPRHWNAFGFAEEFSSSKSLDITCEINIPLSKGTWAVAGAFARDESGAIYIVHTGRIGGGRPGIGRTAFIQHFAGFKSWIDVERSGKTKRAVVVSPLEDRDLIPNLALFVSEVDRIKRLAGKKGLRAGGSDPPLPPVSFRPEFGGDRRPYSTKREIRARVEHGRIVHSLHSLVEGNGIDAWNNQQTDLILERKETAMVEVKTGGDTQSRYTAIGQLLYHSGMGNPKLIAVFPSIDPEFETVLKRLRILGVTWSRKGGGYEFGKELGALLKEL